MPKLPSFADLGNAPSPSVGGTPSFNTGGPTPKQSALATSNLGQEIIQVGTTLAEVDRYNRTLAAREQAATQRALAKAQKEFDNIQTEDATNMAHEVARELKDGKGGYSSRLGKNAVGPAFVDEYTATFDEATNRILQQFDPRIHDQIKRNIAPVRGKYLSGMMGHSVEQTNAYASQVAKDTVKTASDAAKTAALSGDAVGFQAEVAKLRFTINQEHDRLGTPELAEKTFKDTLSSIHLNTIDTLINTKREVAATDYYMQVKSQIDPDAAKGLEGRLTEAVEKRSAQDQRLRKEMQEIKASELDLRITRGEAGYGEIDRYEREGWIDPVKANSFRQKLYLKTIAEGKKEKDDTAKILLVESVINGKGFLDHRQSSHREAVDHYYRTVTIPSLEKVPPEFRAQGITNFIKSVGFIPESVAGQIRGSLRSGDADSRAAAADLLDRIKSSNPLILDDLSKEDIAFGNHVIGLVRSGVPAPQAVKLADDAVRVSPAEREGRNNRYRIDKMAEGNMTHLKNKAESGFFGRMVGVITPDLVSEVGNAPPKIPDALAGEYESLVNAEFLRNGHIETARKTGLDYIKNTWGITQIGDMESGFKPRWMKYAPEVVYKVQGEDGSWIKEQLHQVVTKGAIIDPEAKITIVADDITPREPSPGYRVLVIDREGRIEAVMGNDGKPMRFYPMYEKSKQGLEKKELEEARKARERGALEGLTPFEWEKLNRAIYGENFDAMVRSGRLKKPQ